MLVNMNMDADGTLEDYEIAVFSSAAFRIIAI